MGDEQTTVVKRALAAVMPAEFREGQAYLKLGTDGSMTRVDLQGEGKLTEAPLFQQSDQVQIWAGIWKVTEKGALELSIGDYVLTTVEKLGDESYSASQTYQGEGYPAEFRLFKL